MPMLKQGTAAIALVATLGLVVPGTFGGSASADISDHGQGPYVDTTFTCDLDGDGTYETYDLVSTSESVMWQDTKSNTVIVQRLRVDVLDSFYEVQDDPTGTADDFADPDVYWFDGPTELHGGPRWQAQRSAQGVDNRAGTEVVSYPYTANMDDELLRIGFVEGVTYLETDNLYDVTISGAGDGKVKATSADRSTRPRTAVASTASRASTG